MKTLEGQKTKNLGYFNLALLYSETVRWNIDRWITALRSGEFKQGETFLYTPEKDTYCCLGVANKICELKETNSCGLTGTYRKIGLSNEGEQNG